LQHSESFLQLLGGMEGAHMPGNRRYANRARNSDKGIAVKQSVYETCVELAKSTD